MRKRLLYLLLCAGLAAAAALTALTLPAAAEPQTVTVRLLTGEVVTITVDVPPGTPLDDIELPGEIVPPGTPSEPPAPAPEPQPTDDPAPAPGSGTEQPEAVRRSPSPSVTGPTRRPRPAPRLTLRLQ